MRADRKTVSYHALEAVRGKRSGSTIVANEVSESAESEESEHRRCGDGFMIALQFRRQCGCCTLESWVKSKKQKLGQYRAAK